MDREVLARCIQDHQDKTWGVLADHLPPTRSSYDMADHLLRTILAGTGKSGKRAKTSTASESSLEDSLT